MGGVYDGVIFEWVQVLEKEAQWLETFQIGTIIAIGGNDCLDLCNYDSKNCHDFTMDELDEMCFYSN